MASARTYPDTIERKIGFDTVRQMVSQLCLSPLGQQKAAAMAFSTDYELISRELSRIDEMMRILTSNEDFPLANIHDLTAELKGARVPGTFMSESELVRLRQSLATLTSLASFFAHHRDDEGKSTYPALDLLAAGIGSFPVVVAAIDRVIDKFGAVRDNASAELARIRGSLASMEGAINAAMRRVISQAVREGLIEADTSPSVRDGRPVIPVTAMNKRKIPGIVHDESATGKTFFIEPAEVVEASNRMRELQIEERREIARILVELTDGLRPHIPDMLDSYDILAVFDLTHAKARFALDIGAQRPHLHSHMQLEWYHAVHPVLMLSLKRQAKEVVPLDIRLTEQQRILVISGPNAGGKSVALKTVAIVQYMMQCGLMPPVYENSHMGIAQGIFIDIGDDQSIEDDLSTYSSHLRNMKHLLQHGDSGTLMLIDELGSGTEPQIGGAIAQAMLAEFVDLGMWGIITTHFQNIKQFADDTPGLVNGSMLYDRQLMQPLFKLSIGNPGSSFAIEIARKTGLPDKIIRSAEEIVGSDYINLDKYLLDIVRDKRYWENKRASIKLKEKKIDALIEKYEGDADELRLRRREILDEARSQAKDILDRSNAAIERTIHDIKTANAERQRTLEVRRQLAADRQRLESADVNDHPLLKKAAKNRRKKPQAAKAPVPARPLAPGDRVLLDGQGTVGEVLSIEGKNAVVAFGVIKTTVKTDRLSHTDRQIPKASKSSSYISTSTSEDIRQRQLNFNTEIDVRGMRADEAVQAVTYFIDDAVQFSAQRVRILHGTGTGALRQCIRQYLTGLNTVDSFHDEDVRFGGAGITVVNLA